MILPAPPVLALKCFLPWHVRRSGSQGKLVVKAISKQPTPQTAAVIGAGEHGLLAAVELQSRGYTTTVFESESRVVPIFNSVKLDQVYYDYLSIGLMPSGHFQGGGTTPILAGFAASYDQRVEPFPAALTKNFLSLDSVTGVLNVPSFWASQLGSLAGQQEIFQQLRAGLSLLEQLQNFDPSPSGVLQSGIGGIKANQTYADWAAGVNLPAFTDLSSSYYNAALCGPAALSLATHRLNVDRDWVPGLIRAFLLQAGIAADSPEANALGFKTLLQGEGPPALFYKFPNGLQALFDALVKQEQLNIQLSTAVSAVTEEGVVTLSNGSQLQFDEVVVTIRPPGAAQILPPGLGSVYKGAGTQARDVWIFDATVLPDASHRETLLGPFISFVTVDGGQLGPANGYPSYILRLDGSSSYVSVGAYVTPDMSEADSRATAMQVMQQYGITAQSVVAHKRIAFPSKIAELPTADVFGKIHLAGEAFSDVGLVNALRYVPSRFLAWFGDA